MLPSPSGSFRLFRVAGIDVFLHWSWLLVAVFEVQLHPERYTSPVWNVAEYLTLFGIVLLHELGHALACRQVGGTADRIVLWPLGGIAYVNPPPRPGAVLWSIAAGPLVNLALVPVTVGLFLVSFFLGAQDLHNFFLAVMVINGVLFLFNLLPVYPLDGGQIFQALLWFAIGRARSLLVVSVIGTVAGAVALPLLLLGQWWWGALLAAFVLLRSWAGIRQARLLARLLSGPRHRGAACPSCGEAPFRGDFWVCDECGTRFDTFSERGSCPSCFARFPDTTCPLCLRRHPVAHWFPQGYAPQDREAGVPT
jgi:Zn-dependent protease